MVYPCKNQHLNTTDFCYFTCSTGTSLITRKKDQGLRKSKEQKLLCGRRSLCLCKTHSTTPVEDTPVRPKDETIGIRTSETVDVVRHRTGGSTSTILRFRLSSSESLTRDKVFVPLSWSPVPPFSVWTNTLKRN